MLYEFALIPDVFDVTVVDGNPVLGLTLVQLLRGMCDNGMVANLHKDRWLGYIRDRIERLSPGLKDKVITCFNTLHDRHRFVKHPRRTAGDPVNDSEWLELALESHKIMPFHGIVLSPTLMAVCGHNDFAFMELSGALDSRQWLLSRRRTLTLTKCEADYRAALAPILRYAKALSLVDPWLNAYESRYFDTIRICSKVMGQRGHARLQGRIHIHAELKKQKPYSKSIVDHLVSWEQKLRPLNKQDGHRFKVFLWESLSEGLHDRFLLSDQCAISVPGGLDCRIHSHPNSTDWSLLDEEVRLRRLQDYDPPTSPFQLLGEREIV